MCVCVREEKGCERILKQSRNVYFVNGSSLGEYVSLQSLERISRLAVGYNFQTKRESDHDRLTNLCKVGAQLHGFHVWASRAQHWQWFKESEGRYMWYMSVKARRKNWCDQYGKEFKQKRFSLCKTYFYNLILKNYILI